MPEKNWEKVKDLFHEALLRRSDEREAFLELASAGDATLIGEVRSLLGSFTQAQDFLEMPVVGETVPDTKWHLESGRQISHYKIVGPIGSGGMGEVYLADDERLGRRVALKILPRTMLEDRSRLERFEREANAVSALNHPNILTIFDFEEEDGIRLFASEYVKGVTLREKLESGRMTVIETLEIATQVASALEAAHGAGIIHRDIKPENVMIREDGYVKVLDFGLAKIKEKVKAAESDRTLLQRNNSLPGMIMGTVAYMSPEQARGTRVDERSDLFSLGIIIYEMLAGRPPFCGETTTDILADIIQSEPPQVSARNPQVTVELSDIVAKALAKNPVNRFQNAAGLVVELRSVLRRLEFQAEMERTAVPDSEKTDSSESRKLPSIDTSDALSFVSSERSPLVGREKEIRELTDLLVVRRTRLVTLTGTGGTGKTRLALEMCRRLENSFRDGFAVVRLGEVYDSSALAATVAQQIGVQEIVGAPIADSLRDFLRDKQMLLVIDNFEQVIEAAPFVAELLSAARQLSILVTSRERLHVQAETEVDVPPLLVPDEEGHETLEELEKIDSVRLFVERSQWVNPDFRLTEENATQIAMICSMLDGLPLAIELAAARSRIFPPATILEKLEARLAFLTGGARDLPERQQTMRATVDWSYDLLGDDEKRLFRRLSVFACRFTPAAAEAVASDKEDRVRNGVAKVGSTVLQSVEFLDLFASLSDKSLLIRRKYGNGETGYGLLEIVREYAERALERDDDADEIRMRHAMFYLSLAESAEPYLQTRDSAIWLRRLEDEYDNLRTALRWSVDKAPPVAARLAAAIRHFWHIRGHLSEGLAWAQAILNQDIEMLSAIRWKLLMTCANITQFQGDIDSAYKFYEESLAAARQSGTQTYIANSLRGLGAIGYLKYDFEQARQFLSEALMISRKAGDAFGMAAALARLGDISHVERDLPTARQLTSESLEVFRQVGYHEGVSAKLYNLGAIVYLEGDNNTARKYFQESYKTSIELGEKINIRLIFDGFAAFATEEGDFALAARLSGAAESLGATIGYTIEPAEQIIRDAYLKKLRASMPADEFDAEHEKGRNLTFEQAHELAASQLEEAKAATDQSVTRESPERSLLNGAGPSRTLLVILASLLLLATMIVIFWFWQAS